MPEPQSRDGSLAPLPPVLEFTGEFGLELALFTSFCTWLSRQGLLRERRIKTYRGMRCFYDDLDCLEIIEKVERRKWVRPEDRPAWLPVRDEHTFDGRGRPAQHVYPDLRGKFGKLPLVPDVAAAGKPLLIVHNKYAVEWGRGPVNFIGLVTLESIFRRLRHDFTIVYVRHGTGPPDPGFSEDHNTPLPFADAPLLDRYPEVLRFDDLYREHRARGGTQDLNTFKNVLYSRCYHFISSQGGGAMHIALFSGSLLAILHREGREERWAYGDGYYGFMASVPPIRVICRTERELSSALPLFPAAQVSKDRAVLRPGNEALLAKFSPLTIAERRPDAPDAPAELVRSGMPAKFARVKAARPDDLAIVACHFNPCNYRAPKRNLSIFLRRMRERDLPVFVAELVFPNQTPALGESGGSVRAFRFAGSDVMWHKERLLNLAVARLPAKYTKVAWLDADVIFPDEQWYARASALLESYNLVQLCDTVHRLDDAGREVDQVEGLAAYIARGKPDPFDFNTARCASGLAWAAKRSILDAHGLLDVMIVGGADKYMAQSAYGAAVETADWHFSMLSRGLERARSQWAEAFSEDVAGKVGFLATPVFQLGHGSRQTRKYFDRFKTLLQHDFDPATDVASGPHGLWKWSSDKTAMHEQIARYFANRLEDG